MMEDSYGTCLIGVMDRLWFNQIILFSQTNSLLPPKTVIISPQPEAAPISKTLPYQSSMNSIPEDEIFLSLASSTSIATPLLQDDSGKEEESEKEIFDPKKRLSRLNISSRKTCSHSSSPSSQKHSRNVRYSSSTPVTRLQKSMSCKTLWELEEEEVKGFIDLGFKFDTEKLCPRMMSVVPGLQRLGGCINTEEKKGKVGEKDDEIEEELEGDEEKKGMVLRPYLSEAWLITRPDSPLLNLRIPKESTVADMKKLLKSWARTVAYEI